MGGKTSKSTQAITIPPEVLARYNAINARADTVTNKPYEKYTGEFVAPLTETQRAGMAGVNAAANMAQPYYGAATNQLMTAQGQTQPIFERAGQAIESGLSGAQGYNAAATNYALQGATSVDPRELQIQQFMSPYLQNVLQGTAGILNQQNQQQQAGQMGNAIRSGAFGGDRSGIAAANLNQQQNLANAKIYSDILNQGFNTALGAAQQQQGTYLSADQANRAAIQAASDRLLGIGQTGFGQNIAAAGAGQGLAKDIYGTGAATSAALAGLGTGAQEAALSGAGAQLTAGQVEQATKQAEDTAKYNQFLQEQSLPYQQLKLASDIALGTGTASGSTTTTAQPGGFFSDERLKENIKPVGKTFDGQIIHSYNYKGDPRTQIGLIAQEVQKHHPEAVGLAGGYKTVDYDKATEDAAERGHMAHGGYASMGGGVMPEHAGQGFAGGGVAGFDPAVMQQLLAAQQAMYAPFSQNAGNVYAGGPGAAGGLVPQTEFVARQLMTPAELPRVATGAEQAQSVANLGKTVGELGGEFGAWDWGDKTDGKKTQVPTKAADAAPAATGVAPPKLVDTSAPAPEEFTSRKNPNRPERALGGGMPYSGQGLDIPESDPSSSARQIMTPGEMPGKPESGIDKVGKVAKVAGTVAKAVAMFSDKRVKENIKPIGKLFDGQIVHSYNYKGDPRTQIGLIAQEVEGHKPHAVGVAGGYKTVDYKKATSAAAHRGHFAMGGEPLSNGLMGAEMTGLNEGDQEPDFNLDPEDIISGGDPDAEFFMRDSFKKPESPAQAAGLGALEDKSAEILGAYKPKAPFKPRPTGVAPAPGANRGSGPRSVRNNNPGNIEDGRLAKSMPGYVGSDGRFAIFDAPQAGRAAQMSLIRSYINRGYDTPWKIANRWAPPTEKGNDTQAYAKKIAQMAGVGVHDRVSTSVIPQIANAQTIVEGGQRALSHFMPRDSGDRFASGGLAGRGNYAFGGEPDEGILPNLSYITEDENAPGLAAADTDKPATLATGENVLKGVAAGENPVVSTTRNEGVAGAATDTTESPEIVATGKRLPPVQTAPRQNIYGRGEQKPISYEGGRIPNFGYDYMTEPFFKGLKKGSASSIIPLLTGIAAMGTAPTRSLGVALASGLGAGAQTYAGMANERNKQLVQRQIGTARYADAVKAYFDREFRPLGNGKWYYRGKEISQDEYDQMYSDAINNKTGALIPSIPETAKPYQPPQAPEAPKPVAITDKPDMSTPQGIYAAAYTDPIVVDARNRQIAARDAISKDRALQGDPQIQGDPAAFSAANSRISASQTALTDATGAMTQRLEQLTGVPLSNLSEGQRAVFNQTMEKATALEEQKSAMRPVLQQFAALKDDFKGGTAQGAWARFTDFVKNFGNLTEEQKNLIGSGADANSRQQIMQVIGGPVFDPNNPGPALLWIRDNYIQPRYRDLQSQIQTIKPFTQPTGAPQSSVGVSPGIVSPPARQSGPRTQKGPNNTWIGKTLADIQNDSSIPKGATVFYKNASGQIVQGIK
jgi:hypothetical protein